MKPQQQEREREQARESEREGGTKGCNPPESQSNPNRTEAEIIDVTPAEL